MRALNYFLSRFPGSLRSPGAITLSRFALDQTLVKLRAQTKPAQLAIRVVAAGERSEPAETGRLSLVEPAQLATESFARYRGLNCFLFWFPQARCARQGLLLCRASRSIKHSLHDGSNQACAAGDQNGSRWRAQRACGNRTFKFG